MAFRRFIPSLLTSAIALLAVPAWAQMAVPVHIVPVVAKAQGAAGTDWRSDLSISNLSDATVTVGLAYFPEKQDNVWTMTFPKTVDLGPGETSVVQDVIGSLFPEYGSATKGPLLVMVENATGGTTSPRLAVTSRAYNAADPDATYGQTVPSTQLGIVSGEGVSVMTGVAQNSRFRTNIGIVNLSGTLYPVPGAVRLKARIRIYDEAGNLRYDGVREVEKLSLRQWNLKDDFGIDNLDGGRVEVSVDPSSEGYDPCAVSFGFMGSAAAPALIAYYSKVDNATGDAEFGIGQVDWEQHGADCGETPTDNCGESSGS